MINIDRLKRPQKTESIGARITKDKHEALTRFLNENKGLSASAILEELLTEFLKQKGYL